MLRKLYVTLSFVIIGTLAMAQTGVLKGRLFDKAKNEAIPFGYIALDLNGNIIAQGESDIDGNFTIKPIPPGKYTLKAKTGGFKDAEIRDVIISADKTTYVNDVVMTSGVTELGEVVFTEYIVPLIDPNTISGKTVTQADYEHMASKSINSVAATTAGVYQADEGKALNMRGARSTSTEYYIDGVKVIGGHGVPQQSVEQITVITGGLPAQYGDATGGIISVSTRGPQSQFFSSVQMETSQFLDAYGHNSVNFTVGGPILSKRDSTGIKQTKLGYIISGELSHDKDPSPSAVGFYKVNDEKMAYLEEHPLIASPSGGFLRSAEFVRMSDLEKIKARQNVAQKGAQVSGNIDFKPTQNMSIRVGGSMEYQNYHNFTYEYALFNPVNNPQVIDKTYRGYVRLTQKFGDHANDEKSTSLIKNAFYTVQVGYNNYKQTVQDDTHKDKYFDYGYVGTFHQYKSPTFDMTKARYGNQIYQNAFQDTLITFAPGGKNLTTENYTEEYYSLLGAQKVNGFYTTPGFWYDYFNGEAHFNANSASTGSSIQNGLGLLNGDRPSNIYSNWYNTGRQYGGFSKLDNNQISITTSFSADVKDHAIQLGFEYEQRTERSFGITVLGSPTGLWYLMRSEANKHFIGLDSTRKTYYGTDALGYDFYTLDRKLDTLPDAQSYFDKSLRQKLGLNINGTDWIDTDSYGPEMYSLDMFSADELLANGTVNYYGFDYTGKKTKGNPSFSDFFNKKDANGNLSRPIAPFQPIYMAGYIQDKFDFRDLKFNVGVRVDRYDANQKVLKDKYLLVAAKTAGEVSSLKSGNVVHPSNIGSDYVVYANTADVKSATQIVGYRNGDIWYDANGVEVADPATIATKSSTGQIQPLLVNPDDKSLKEDVFRDYVPQINVMPRIAFSFPISDEANFFAHYDVLTQRPSTQNRFDILGYYNLQKTQGAILDNPDLKPERTTDYELGFSQVLNEKKNSALTLSAFYRQMRDMAQIIAVNYAYFESDLQYLTYGNIDFGTVKGFSVAYDLRRTGPIQLNASYTLQFAEGTGSGAADNYNLVSTGQPNLRSIVPLDFDRRHAIVASIDYRFGSGKEYYGLTWNRKKGDESKALQLLANMGANLTFTAGSGPPYTKQTLATPDGLVGINNKSKLKGSVNGASLPWQMRMDLRVDKDITLTWGKADGDKKKTSNLNIYVVVLNALNTKNILSVYKFTGNPDDDGYLADASAQNSINASNDPQSFRDLYSVKINNPSNYSIPRRIHLGVTLDF
jgi:hypothetical protein